MVADSAFANPSQVAELQYKTSIFFEEEVDDPSQPKGRRIEKTKIGRYDFNELVDLFALFLSQGNMTAGHGWLDRARLWRALFLQHEDGHWDYSHGIAPAIRASRADMAPEGLRINKRLKYQYLEGKLDFIGYCIGDNKNQVYTVPKGNSKAPARVDQMDLLDSQLLPNEVPCSRDFFLLFRSFPATARARPPVLAPDHPAVPT